MTRVITEAPEEENTISTAQISEFLKKNPDFFRKNEYLLGDLELPPHATGAAVSFIEKQSAVLRNRNTELRNRLNQLISVANDNDQLFNLTKKLNLSLMEATSIRDIANSIKLHLLRNSNVNCASFHLVNTGQLPDTSLFFQTTEEEIKSKFGMLLENSNTVCGTHRKDELDALFPGYKYEEGSAVITTLRHKTYLGLFAIGSFNPAHFRQDMDTSFVSYIGEVLSRQLFNLLSKPKG